MASACKQTGVGMETDAHLLYDFGPGPKLADQPNPTVTLRRLILFAAFPAFLAAADQPAKAPAAPHAPAPVSVSSLNYADTPRDVLAQLEAEKTAVNPATRPLAPLARPQRYVFMPGDLYETDLDFGEICRRLGAALAQKGYLNATDEQGRVIAPNEVDLILRVHGGERPWRVPTARTDQLTWRDGLASRPRGRTLATLGGDVFWENRAGGNDAALGAAAANENARGFGFGSAPATPAGGDQLNAGSATGLSMAGTAAGEYESTRDFYLLVVDAFSYADLMKRGKSATRLWTTFIAAPRQPGQKFSGVLDTMLRVATPYFGENTAGLQMFNDARATVSLGELQILESDVKAPERK